MEEKIVLIADDGSEHEFEVEAILEIDDEKYAVLIPQADEYDDGEEAIIMKFGKDDDGEDVLFDIEDDDEWDKVADAYDELLDEEDDIEIEDLEH
ncbi:MAG: DUF1292 domain-containing protein [Clostridia bacterium]|nr:DUF1292 domain-containing protein [Clostridia bacterium]MDD4798596.1 DUF1292 domain-containing protein [Clostridia bacterium]